MATSGSFEVTVDGNVHGGTYATRDEAERAATQLRGGAAQGKNVVVRETSTGERGHHEPLTEQRK